MQPVVMKMLLDHTYYLAVMIYFFKLFSLSVCFCYCCGVELMRVEVGWMDVDCMKDC